MPEPHRERADPFITPVLRNEGKGRAAMTEADLPDWRELVDPGYHESRPERERRPIGALCWGETRCQFAPLVEVSYPLYDLPLVAGRPSPRLSQT